MSVERAKLQVEAYKLGAREINGEVVDWEEFWDRWEAAQ